MADTSEGSMTPRCDRPVTPRETPGNPAPGIYAEAGLVIRQARKALGMTQAEVADVLGAYGYLIVCRWESGLAYPMGGGAVRLERLLGIRLPGPRCGRPEGHRGWCRSAAAVTRYLERAAIRRAA